MEVRVTPRLNSFLLGTVGFSLFASAALAQPAPAAAPAPDAQPPAAAEPTAAPPAPPADPAPAPAPAPAPEAAPAPAPEPAAPAEPPKKPGPPSFKIEAGEGTNIKLGVLLQPQFQAQGDVTADGTAINLFVRRARILVGGSLFGVVDYFIDTDFANMMLGNQTPPNTGAMPPTPGTTIKATPGMNVQDAFATLKPLGSDVFKVDLGYMLPPMSHNAVQSAASLYSWDYFGNSFRHSNVFGTSADPVGRDTGVQLRGLVVDNHLEYRLGLFQGKRREPGAELGSQNMFRVAGRVQANILEPETGFFYGGTYLGTKSIFSIGAAFDIQDEYKYFAGDAFVDLPLGEGVFTAQLNFAHYEGGDWVTLPPALPEGNALMAEAGYLFKPVNVSPIVRFEKTLPTDSDVNSETRWALGVAYWPYGHNLNIKAFFSQRTVEDADHAANQVNLQTQVYVF
jgi:hypothetical protein